MKEKGRMNIERTTSNGEIASGFAFGYDPTGRSAI
jgi:hypothetical protein